MAKSPMMLALFTTLFYSRGNGGSESRLPGGFVWL